MAIGDKHIIGPVTVNGISDDGSGNIPAGFGEHTLDFHSDFPINITAENLAQLEGLTSNILDQLNAIDTKNNDFGGGSVITSNLDVTLVSDSDRVLNISMGLPDLSAILPDATTLIDAGQFFCIINSGGESFFVKNSGLDIIGSLAPNTLGIFLLLDKSTSNGKWMITDNQIPNSFALNTPVFSNLVTASITEIKTIKIDESKYLVVYSDGVSGKARIVSFDGQNTTIGNAVNFSRILYKPSLTQFGKNLFGYSYHNGNSAYIGTIEISGDSIIFNSETIAKTDSNGIISTNILGLDNYAGCFSVTYGVGSSLEVAGITLSNAHSFVVGIFSSVDSGVDISGCNLEKVSKNSALMIWGVSADGILGRVFVFSGLTVVSSGTQTTLSTYTVQKSSIKMTESEFLLTYCINNSTIFGKIITVNITTISLGTETQIFAGTNIQNLHNAKISDTQFFILFSNLTSARGIPVFAKTSILPGSPITVYNNSINKIDGVNIVDFKIFCVIVDNSSVKMNVLNFI